MANPEHLQILKQGVEVWNKWREENPEISPDLSEANLSEANLSEADLIKANLSEAYLSGADLSRAYLRGAYLIEADLRRAKLREVDLRGADLRGADLSGADLRKADLSGADLRKANLSEANLIKANFSEADLRRAYLSAADLRKANLTEANLIEANLSGAYLREAYLSGSNVGWSNFGDIDLSVVKGLDTVKHVGPSTVGIDTIYESKGNIPEVFLRGAGVPDNFIEYMVSLTGQAIQFYSCFISYSSNDRDFAERLYADLQNKGVRCWFAPEDMKIGDKIRIAIDQAIHVNEKLLLILSETSVKSQWVEQEVETALQIERDEDRLVLFPIRVDDAVMIEKAGWASYLKKTRDIGDFRQWKDHDAYRKAFDRLLRDLKAED